MEKTLYFRTVVLTMMLQKNNDKCQLQYKDYYVA
jgi:hypothetical protein